MPAFHFCCYLLLGRFPTRNSIKYIVFPRCIVDCRGAATAALILMVIPLWGSCYCYNTRISVALIRGIIQ
jgi:hypothetical protein